MINEFGVCHKNSADRDPHSGVVGVGIEKYVTPWLGFGIEHRLIWDGQDAEGVSA